MRLLGCVLLLAGLVSGQEDPTKRAIEFIDSGAAGAFEKVATHEQVDPWLVAHDLIGLDRIHDARALAAAARSPDTNLIARYVEVAKRDADGYARVLRIRLLARQGNFAAVLGQTENATAEADPLRAAVLLSWRAQALYRQQRLAESVETLREVIRRTRELGWLRRTYAMFGLLRQIGVSSAEIRLRYEACRGQVAVEKARQREGGHGLALANYGTVLSEMGDLAGAIAQYELSESLVATHRRNALFRVLDNYGLALTRAGRFAEALRVLKRAELACNPLNDLYVQHLRARAGDAVRELGDPQRALRLHRQAAARFKPEPHRKRYAEIVGECGLDELALRDFDAATTSFEQARKVFHSISDTRGVRRASSNLGVVARIRGRYDRAVEIQTGLLEGADAAGDYVVSFGARDELGDIEWARGDTTKALAHFRDALAQAERAGSTFMEYSALQSIARLHFERSEWTAAVASARKGATLLPLMVRSLAVGEGAFARAPRSELFETGALAGAAANDAALVFEFLEEGRAGSLREALDGRGETSKESEAVAAARSRLALAAARVRELLAKPKVKRKVLRAQRRLVEDARNDLFEAVTAVERKARAGSFGAARHPASLHEFAAKMASGDALVLYALCGDLALTLVVTKKSSRIVKLGPSAAIAAACEASEHGAGMEEVRKLAVAPLKLGDDVRRVLLSPDGALCYVPLGSVLGKREVAYVPSGTVLGMLRARAKPGAKPVLAVADPDYSSDKRLSALPGTRVEAKAIADQTLLGPKANREELLKALPQQPRWRAVHFACHGVLDPKRPERTSLMLSGTVRRLHALDIARMSIPADLVTLSACNTARGRLVKGEGVVGLTRAFFIAGADRVLVSLWKVDDAATSAFMIEFYGLWKSGKSAAGALRGAEEHVRSQPKWKDPKYWAAWQLWGLPD